MTTATTTADLATQIRAQLRERPQALARAIARGGEYSEPMRVERIQSVEETNIGEIEVCATVIALENGCSGEPTDITVYARYNEHGYLVATW